MGEEALFVVVGRGFLERPAGVAEDPPEVVVAAAAWARRRVLFQLVQGLEGAPGHQQAPLGFGLDALHRGGYLHQEPGGHAVRHEGEEQQGG